MLKCGNKDELLYSYFSGPHTIYLVYPPDLLVRVEVGAVHVKLVSASPFNGGDCLRNNNSSSSFSLAGASSLGELKRRRQYYLFLF